MTEDELKTARNAATIRLRQWRSGKIKPLSVEDGQDWKDNQEVQRRMAEVRENIALGKLKGLSIQDAEDQLIEYIKYAISKF